MLIDAALEKLRILLQDRVVKVEIEENLPDASADAELIGLALRQLLTNALKYANPETAIIIRARRADGFIRISVKDSGPGIAPKDLQRIFERYYRVQHNSDRVPGTGMGLEIARDIVQAHGGAIWVESVVGQGSEFFFTLPAVEEVQAT